MITADQLVSKYPEFEQVDFAQIETAIEDTLIETNGGYPGITNCDQRKLAVMLHTAHYVAVIQRQASLGYAAPLKALENRQDRVEFVFNSKNDKLDSTHYGQRLLSLLKTLRFTVAYVSPC
jgi:hypothetical protein